MKCHSYKCGMTLTSGLWSTGFNSLSQASGAGWHSETRLSTTATHRVFIVSSMPRCCSRVCFILISLTNCFCATCTHPPHRAPETVTVNRKYWHIFWVCVHIKQTKMQALQFLKGAGGRLGLTGCVSAVCNVRVTLSKFGPTFEQYDRSASLVEAQVVSVVYTFSFPLFICCHTWNINNLITPRLYSWEQSQPEHKRHRHVCLLMIGSPQLTI